MNAPTLNVERSASPKAAGVFAVQCAWCRFWRFDVLWVSECPAPLKGLPVSHGICGECSGRQLREIAAEEVA